MLFMFGHAESPIHDRAFADQIGMMGEQTANRHVFDYAESALGG
jgi:hypothetical protein